MVQLSHQYMTRGKNIAFTRQTFVGKLMSLLFNMPSRWVIVFLPRSKHLLISWLQSPSAVILEPMNIKCVTVSIVSPSICHEVMIPEKAMYRRRYRRRQWHPLQYFAWKIPWMEKPGGLQSMGLLGVGHD